MRKVMLLCNAGMSTSLLVKKMQEAADNNGEDFQIYAVGLAQADSEIKTGNVDVVLVGPQVRFKEKEFKDKYEPDVKVSVIDTVDYGMVNGEKVFNYAKGLID